MPYLGMLPAGETVTPLDVDKQDTVHCPLCEEELGIRDAHYNRGQFVSRHFYHKPSTDCDGKSPLPSKYKTIAAHKLREVFTQATVTHEVQVGNRVADVVATFEDPLAPFGKGFIVDVQSRQDLTDGGSIVAEFLEAGYSVYWATQPDFDDHDMTVAHHRVRTVWPDAVPDVEEWTGYPDCVQTLRVPTSQSLDRDVPIPREYWRAHALEVASPTRGRPGDAVTAPGWEALETVWVHTGGSEKAWVNLLRAPRDHVFLEFWTKDRGTDETAFLPARVAPDTAAAFEQFLESVRTAFDKQVVRRSDEYEGVSVASVEFAGTQPCESWLSIAKPPGGQLEILVGRRDRRGNTRTLAVNYRPLDFSSLVQLRDALDTVWDTDP